MNHLATRSLCGAVCFFALVLALVGCDSQPAFVPKEIDGSESVRGELDLSQALDSLRKLSDGGGPQPAARTVFYLNQWLNRGAGLGHDWKPDRLSENIPRALQITPGLATLDLLEFGQSDPSSVASPQDFRRFQQDVMYLQQNLWLHDIAERTRRDAPPAELVAWLKELETSVGLTESEQLAAAQRLFDWTIRNTQLDELPPPPKGPVATVGEGTEPIAPALTGELGPGYGHLPVQVLKQGHGDAQERGRLFLLLCRQAGIDAVVLARLDEQVSSTPQPWTIGVLLKKELYLFEPQLGLPIPGPGLTGIATLSQALSDPAVLRQLDVSGGPAYPLSADDLQHMVALIDAEPEALSRRMAVLQKALPSAHRMVLTVEPSRLEPDLRACRGISTVSLWRVPLEAILYQFGRMSKLATNPDLARKFEREERMFLIDSPLMIGRNMHLEGRFETVDLERGARAHYLSSRLPDEERQLLYTSAAYRERIGFGQALPADEQQRVAMLEAMVSMMQRAKQHASYWLGLTYYESGKFETAIEWLDLRTLQAPIPGPWVASARYNLGRSYEALGQPDKAVAIYEADNDSPQRHGNLLRAQWLKREASREKSDTDSP
ncbi:MAG: tetratricopeptide repeat protein [Pirellulaceae bacterium]